MFTSDYHTHLLLQWIDSLPSFVFSLHALAPQDFQSILLRLSSAANGPKSRWQMASCFTFNMHFQHEAMSCQPITFHLLWLSIQTSQLHVEFFLKMNHVPSPHLSRDALGTAMPCEGHRSRSYRFGADG